MSERRRARGTRDRGLEAIVPFEHLRAGTVRASWVRLGRDPVRGSAGRAAPAVDTDADIRCESSTFAERAGAPESMSRATETEALQ
jgi:hypothetical protein